MAEYIKKRVSRSGTVSYVYGLTAICPICRGPKCIQALVCQKCFNFNRVKRLNYTKILMDLGQGKSIKEVAKLNHCSETAVTKIRRTAYVRV